jgi:50S ribosomal protein L16 3-hydroxylase
MVPRSAAVKRSRRAESGRGLLAKEGRARGNGFGLSPAFWARFVENHWRRRPLILKRPFSVPLATGADILRGIVNARAQFRADDLKTPLKFFVEQTLLQAEVQHHLPAARDSTLEDYVARVTSKLRGRPFGVIVTEYPPFDAQTWLRLREFLRPLYARIGIPGNPTQTGLFLGTYARTPFGVHKDLHDTFIFMIEGRKKFRTWPAEFFREEQDMTRSLHYRSFLDRATTLDAEAGDVLYWPSSYWHVAEPVGGFAASMSLAVFADARPAFEVVKHALAKLDARLGAAKAGDLLPFHPDRLQESANALPRIVEDSATALRKVSRSPALKESMTVEWLNRLTSFGFDSAPPPLAPKTPEDDEILRGDPDYPILWLPGKTGEIICSANGYSFSVTSHPRLVRLLERLNSGAPSCVRNLLEKRAGRSRVNGAENGGDAETLRTVLEKLCSLRAVTTVAGRCPRRS